MAVPSETLSHNNHRRCNFKELSLGSSKLPQKLEIDRRTMSFATQTGSAHAIGLNKKHSYHATKQAMANASCKDVLDCRSSMDRQELRSINDAESLKKLLLDNGCKVAVLKLVGDDDNSPSKVTYEVTDSNLEIPSTGQINHEFQAVNTWVKETKSTLSKSFQDLLCLAWTSKDMM